MIELGPSSLFSESLSNPTEFLCSWISLEGGNTHNYLFQGIFFMLEEFDLVIYVIDIII